MGLKSHTKTILFFLLVISLAFNAVLISKPSKLAAFLPANDNTEIKNFISEIVKINFGEDPTIAEVKDIESLRGEDPVLYKNVENGDKILIYPKMVVIYRPNVQKIVQVIQLNE